MATKGVKSVFISLIDEDGNTLTGPDGIYKNTPNAIKDTAGVFEMSDTTVKGIVSYNLSGMVGQANDIQINGQLVRKLPTKGKPVSTIVVNDIPNNIKTAMLNSKKTDTGGFKIDGYFTSRNYVRIVVETSEAFNDKPVYIVLNRGIIYEQQISLNTSTETISLSNDNIVIEHLDDEDGFGEIYYSSVNGVDRATILAQVFHYG